MYEQTDQHARKPNTSSRRQWTAGSLARGSGTVCVLLLCAALETTGTAAQPAAPTPDLGSAQYTNASPATLQQPPAPTANNRPNILSVVPLTARDLQIAEPTRNLPPNVAAEFFGEAGIFDHGIGTHRSWAPSGIAWQPSALHYRPLYFQDVHLERYGISLGIVQPAVSAAHAFGQFLALPALMVLHHPYQRTYPLGY